MRINDAKSAAMYVSGLATMAGDDGMLNRTESNLLQSAFDAAQAKFGDSFVDALNEFGAVKIDQHDGQVYPANAQYLTSPDTSGATNFKDIFSKD